MAEAAGPRAAHLARLVGGPRGLVEGGLPPIVFVTTNALVSARSGQGAGLDAALVAASVTAVALTALALAQRRPLRQAIAGLLGLAVAAGYAAWVDDARAFFLPGMLVDGVYAIALGVSVLAGRPLLGYLHGWLLGRRHRWWDEPRVRRAFAVVTLGWAAVYALRAGAQGVLYIRSEPELLAVAKIGLGWPLTVVSAMATLAFLRRRV